MHNALPTHVIRPNLLESDIDSRFSVCVFSNLGCRWAHGYFATSLTEGSQLKTRIAFVPLFLLFLALAVVPTVAQDLYDNGPINGNT